MMSPTATTSTTMHREHERDHLLGVDRLDVDLGGRQQDRDTQQHDLSDDVAHVDQQAARRDRRREIDALLLEEPDLRGHAADRGHREIGERHRELQLGGADEREVDGHRAHERDRGGEVGEQRDDHGQDQPPRVGVGDRVPQLLRAAHLAEQGEDRR